MRYPRFGIRSLLLVTAVAAVVLSFSLPFVPKIEVVSFAVVPQKESIARLPGQRFRLELANASSYKCWMPDNSLPTVVAPSGLGSSEPITLHIGVSGEDGIQLAPGNKTYYDIVLPDNCDQISLVIFARDWRGRTGYRHLGVISAGNGE